MTTNFELLSMIEKLNIPHFREVLSKNELVHLKPNTIESLIINLQDNDKGNGTHWIATYKNNDRVYYFDSYGVDPPNEILEYYSLPILTHNFQIQKLNETNCGEYCVLFLYLMNKGLHYEDIILSLSE